MEQSCIRQIPLDGTLGSNPFDPALELLVVQAVALHTIIDVFIGVLQVLAPEAATDLAIGGLRLDPLEKPVACSDDLSYVQ